MAVTGPSTLSDADTVYVMVAPAVFVAGVAIRAGKTNTGGTMSRTVTVNVAAAVFPEMSPDEHVTVVVPRSNVVPDTGVHVVAGISP